MTRVYPDGENAPLLKAIVAAKYLSYEQKRKILQDVMARSRRQGEEHKDDDFSISHALDMLEATVITNQDMPEQAPQKSGYSPAAPSSRKTTDGR